MNITREQIIATLRSRIASGAGVSAGKTPDFIVGREGVQIHGHSDNAPDAFSWYAEDESHPHFVAGPSGPATIVTHMTPTQEAAYSGDGVKPKKVRAGNKWMDHVKEYKKSHPGISYKDVLKGAKGTYKK